MEERVYGLENEYACLYVPTGCEPAPLLQRTIYEHLEAVVRERYPHLPARGVKGGVFLGNGALLHYEARLERYEQGLCELNTPECTSARELCLYHRVNDELLRDALPAVAERLAALGYSGRLSFAKANVDRDGRTFGATENYLCDDPLPLGLRLFQAPTQALFTVLALCAHGLSLLPILLGAALLLGHLALGVVLLPLGILAALFPGERGFGRVANLWEHLTGWVMSLFDARRTLALLGAYTTAVFFPLVLAYTGFARLVYLRRQRRLLVPFLATRTIYAGNGRVDFSHGRSFFRLSSRADAIHAGYRVFWNDPNKPMLDIKHLFLGFREPWRRQKRLAVLYSDGHLCEKALVLTVGVTGLVLEAIEAGAFAGAAEVRLHNPIEALHAVNGDPTLSVRLRLHNGEELTALEHQRRFVTIVRTHLRAGPVLDLRKFQLLQTWEATLSSLASEPHAQLGVLDWVTKRYLLEEAAGGPEGMETLGRWAPVLSLVDGAGLTDAELALPPDALWRRLCERLPPASRRALEAALAAGRLARSALGEMCRLGYTLRKLDFKYHDLHPQDGYATLLATAGVLDPVVSAPELAHARAQPPPGTRAFARGRAIQRTAALGHRGKASWESVTDLETKKSLRLHEPLSPTPKGRGDLL